MGTNVVQVVYTNSIILSDTRTIIVAPPLFISDLASDNPYNTYRHDGLPPGPIANPGLGSLKAALSPEATGHLYFVAKADGSGGHNFTDSLQQHQAAVAEYRRATKNR